jgi:polyisoprenoid-binding protein YceI
MTTVQTAEKAGTDVSTWTIDGAHSSAEFAVKHMMVSTVKGRFRSVAGTLQIDEADPTRSSIEASIDVASVDTGAEQRDEHLRSDDFFNVEAYPAITFRGTRISGAGDEWKLDGDLTIRDVTRPVSLDVEFEGKGPDAFGGERAGFAATTKINRRDFGVNWNGLIEAGGVVVSDTVKITLNIEAVKQ